MGAVPLFGLHSGRRRAIIKGNKKKQRPEEGLNEHESRIAPLVLQAGRMILDARDVEMTGRVTEKAEDAANLVTAYDKAVQDYLVSALTALYPDACFLAEEQENDAAVLTAPRCFVIDPIDGTANFIHGLCHSSVSLAMLESGKIVFGAVYDPYLDELYTATLGGGAYLNGRRISVSGRTPRHAMTVFGTSPYQKERFGNATFRLAEALCRKTRDVRRSGSAALDLAAVAAGRADIFFELALSPWDMAAGLLLIREAGGTVTGLDGAHLELGGDAAGVLAANPACYGFLLTEARAVLDDNAKGELL